ncbi:hypothetical protein DXG01_012692 [Tephrocybe rancida]|nr:hypothetical protein DXG01_012692 [Tephrocybe rancida]
MPFFTSSKFSFRGLVSKKSKKVAAVLLDAQKVALSNKSSSVIEDDRIKLQGKVGDAFHDPSVVDVRRNMVYGLNNFVVEITNFTAIDSSAASSLFQKPSPSPTIVVEAPPKKHSAPTPAPKSAPAPEPPVSAPIVLALAELEITKVLGIGASGQVYMTRNRRTHARRALKVVSHRKMSFGQLFGVREEQAILQSLALHARSEDGGRHVVLADFGLSRNFHLQPTLAERVFQPFWPYAREDLIGPNTPRRDGRDEKLKFTLFAMCGTGLYMAPELLRREPYSFGVDFWALAAPFDCQSEDFDDVRKEILCADLDFWKDDELSEEAQDLLSEMLEKNPDDRLRITELEDHPFFAGMNWPLMETHEVRAPWIPDSEEPCFVLQEEPTQFIPGAAFDDMGPYPDFDWAAVTEDEFDEVDLAEPMYETDVVLATEQNPGVVKGAKEKEETISVAESTTTWGSKPSSFRAFWQRIWPWAKANKAGTPPYSSLSPSTNSNTTSTLSMSTLELPPTPPPAPDVSPRSATWLELSTTQVLGPLPPPPPSPSPSSISVASLNTVTPCSMLSPPPAPSLLLIRHVENGTGIVFKLKLWLKRLLSCPPPTSFIRRCDVLV